MLARLPLTLGLCLFMAWGPTPGAHASSTSWDDPARALVVVEDGSLPGFRAALAVVRAEGGRVREAVPPHLAIVDLAPGAESRLLGRAGITAVHRGALDPTTLIHLGRVPVTVGMAWNRMKAGLATAEPEPGLSPKPLVNDTRIEPEQGQAPPPGPQLLEAPYGADWRDTSEFMWGAAAVGVILAESNGELAPETEDWTAEEEANVASELLVGADWWVDHASYPLLSFTFEMNYRVPTGWEPINTADLRWKNQCLDSLGYASARAYADTLRDRLDTDWANVVFIADSSNDSDGCFPDGSFAYATLGGPSLTMTYTNDGWGIGNMDAVWCHETGHIYYALDEYQSSGCTCTERSGYLNEENQNCQRSCLLNQGSCIMRSKALAFASVCPYTKHQLGWLDTDGDLIPDILDTAPETVLDAYAPDPSPDCSPTYTGTAHVTAIPNLNPRGQGHDITVATISLVEVRTDGGAWQPAEPADGLWDSGVEAFTYWVPYLAAGQTHVVEARAVSSVGNADTTVAADTLTIMAGASVAPGAAAAPAFRLEAARPNPFGPATELRFSLAAEGEARLDIYDIRGARVSSLVSGRQAAGEHRVVWNGRGRDGVEAPAGVYFARLEADGKVLSCKMLLAR